MSAIEELGSITAEVMAQGWEESIKDIAVKDPRTPRLANRRLLLTYKGHIEKEFIIGRMNELCYEKLKKDCARVEVAHEIGRKTGIPYPHTHVAVDFGRQFTSKHRDCMRLFDVKDKGGNVIHPNIKAPATDKHWVNVMKYLAKEDKDNSHLLQEFPDESLPKVDVDGIMACGTVLDAIKTHAKSIQDVTGIIALRNQRNILVTTKRTRPPIDRNEKEWWAKMFEIHDSPPDPRSIHWFYDKTGGAGKTRLSRLMRQEYPEDWAVMRPTKNVDDAAEVLYQLIAGGWNGHGIIVDVPRDCNEWKSLYRVLEEVKDGYITSGKYNTKTIDMFDPHVVVLSNKTPLYNKMSIDRWRLYTIEGDGVETATKDEIEILASNDADANYLDFE